MIYFFFILLNFIDGQPLFNLFYTNLITENNDIFEHDCLRSITTNRYLDGNVQLMSFCLSENVSVFDIKDDENISKFTFIQLSNKNITAEQLYYWSAPIDTIEQYQDYLNTKNIILENEIFYNCTLRKFGNRCQYEFTTFMHTNKSLYDNLYDIFQAYDIRPMPVTCYKHIECHRSHSIICLDWRDICNGEINCLNDGIDEKDCWQLEIKECKENEYRCLSGQCIAKVMVLQARHFETFCFGKRDTIHTLVKDSHRCSHVYNLFRGCDDIICSNDFSSPSCYRNYQSLILMAMHSNEDESLLNNNCSLAVAFFFRVFTSTKFCQENQCIQIIENDCPEIFFYPHIPVLFGSIYFAYMKKDFINITQYTYILPYVCFNTTDYDNFFRHMPIFLINNIRCIHASQFYDPLIAAGDLIGSLYNVSKRYHLSMNYTTDICNRSNMYQCIDSLKCINIYRILDGINDCPEMDDENISKIKSAIVIENLEKNYFKCQINNKYIPEYSVLDIICDCELENEEYCEDEHLQISYIKTNILFQHICDRYIELSPLLIDGINHTDETECQQWECDNIYTHCNQEWNCLHAEDETNCPSNTKLSFINCSLNSHECVSTQTYKLICLPTEKINDGSIDCLGGTDEIYDQHLYVFLISKYDNNFHCIKQNSSEYISIHSLCDGKNDCEYGDDERFCTTNRTYSDYGICHLTNLIISTDVEKFFCYHKNPVRPWRIKNFEISLINNELQFKSSFSSTKLFWNNEHSCHFGLPVRLWLNPKNRSFIWTCFCPARYYGPQCQYQNQRISLTLQFQTLSDSSNILFTVIISLIDDRDEKLIHSYESFIYLSTQNCRKYFLLTLHYSHRPKNATKQYFIRIDIYEKLTLYHRGSLLYPIEFSFLPVHRLGFIVDIPSNNTDIVSCKNKQCQHGQCMKYWNQPDNITFCQCDKEWRGKYCHIPYNCECSSDSVCFDVLSNSRSICLCPKNRLGTRCLISSTNCQQNMNSTCSNNGECIVTEDYNGLNNEFICLCNYGFSGTQCEFIDNKLILSFNQEIILSQSIFIHFISLHMENLHRFTTFKTMPLRQDFVTIYSPKEYHIVFIELLNKHYYLGSISKDKYSNGSVVNKTIQISDHCPNITELFNETFLQWHLIRRIKYYHLPCQNQSLNLSCFHDEIHFCLCYNFYGKRLANCFLFEHNQTYDCFGRSECEHNSQCIQETSTCPQQSMCICRDCFFGRKCQFRTDQFGLSLDAILGYHIVPLNNFSIQPLIIKISLLLTIIFMTFGLINGILSLITFANKTICEVGCGLYLMTISITAILITIFFSFKFLILILRHMIIIENRLFLKIQCYSFDFLIRVCICFEQWLAACVAFERAVIIVKGPHFTKQKSKETAKKVVLILVFVIILSFIHDPFSRDLIHENDEINYKTIKRTWCIIRYQSGIELYNYIIQTFHFIGPFLVNLICSIVLIIKKSRQNAVTITNLNRSFKLTLENQFNEHKHLLIAPIVLVILAIPRMILIYTSKCMKSANDVWLYLFGYFISFIPSMLTLLIFILPSKFYKEELQQTIKQYRQIIRRRLHLRF